MPENSREQIWPSLDYAAWRETCATLQLWTQIAGKIRLALGPWINHSWGVTLYVTSRGLTTSLIPYGTRAFEIEFESARAIRNRSEEHTSELQSLRHLVCRLLLEKKKKKKKEKHIETIDLNKFIMNYIITNR